MTSIKVKIREYLNTLAHNNSFLEIKLEIVLNWDSVCRFWVCLKYLKFCGYLFVNWENLSKIKRDRINTFYVQNSINNKWWKINNFVKINK